MNELIYKFYKDNVYYVKWYNKLIMLSVWVIFSICNDYVIL